MTGRVSERRWLLIAATGMVATLAVALGVLSSGRAEAGPFLCEGKLVTIIGQGEIKGTPHADVIIGSPKGDRILAGARADTVCGRDGNDRINGQNGKDVLLGENGGDHIIGHKHTDRMFGNAGDDTLEDLFDIVDTIDEFDGGKGTDTCLSATLGDTANSCEFLPSGVINLFPNPL